MDDFQRLERKAYIYLLLMHLLVVLTGVGIWLVADHFKMPLIAIIIGATAGTLFVAGFAAKVSSKYTLQPLHTLWQAILHVAPDINTVPAPNMEKVRLGQELVNSLALRVY